MGDDSFDWNKQVIANADGPAVPMSSGIVAGGVGGLGDVRHSFGDCEYRVCPPAEVVAVAGCLDAALARWIRNSEFVFACFAWLTNYRVLDSLASCSGCQVVVQKEDFLRPDAGHGPRSNETLRRKYEALRCPVARYFMPGVAGGLSVCYDQHVDAVRCAGVANQSRRKASPRMHHKFAVRCAVDVVHPEVVGLERQVSFRPTAVWTGSFNPTANGAKSRENAVCIESEQVASFYLDEWSKVFAMSEPLNWTSEWMEPEYRIGT
jgi:hypothetical protein